MSKYRHATTSAQTRPHVCHWPGCDRQVPPALWGCRQHWAQLPKRLQNAIWKTYRPGQEVDGRPSLDYRRAAAEVQAWIAAQKRRENRPETPPH